MSGQTLHGREVVVCREHVGNEGSAQVVRTAGGDARLFASALQPDHGRLRRDRADSQASGLVDRAEQRSGTVAADGDPGVDGPSGVAGRECGALPVPLADHAKRSGAPVVVADLKGDRLGAAQPGTVEQGERRAVAESGRRRIRGAGREQPPDLARFERTARRRPASLHAGDVDGPHVVLRSDLAQAPARLQDAPKGREVLVGRRGGHFRGDDRPDGRDVLEAEALPGNVGRAGKACERGEPVERAAHAVAGGTFRETAEVDGGRVFVRPGGRDAGNGGKTAGGGLPDGGRAHRRFPEAVDSFPEW